ncbi:histone-lysine N-methyltransferase, H3 lysine-9 specific SUVH1 isoform X1 [Triticum aestivum]|uniref:histone-lysine N-methyltransferase, H3 lysine-9 specific SUVH1 isoform X1 n=1 Tax=Triticum aestivum TaxID=4565 RepID=UPI001D01CAF7|nr:histone-lysine N-methyltransferase, H3 lysine-9 specific SUVH1-like isoform X1 [Triticum aestivum]
MCYAMDTNSALLDAGIQLLRAVMDRTSNFMPTPDQDVLDIQPLRTLAPMFPAPLGVNTFNVPNTTPPLIFVTSAGQFPGGVGAPGHPAFRSFAAAFGAQDAYGGQPASSGGQHDGGGHPASSRRQDGGGGQATTFADKYAANGGQTAANGATNLGASADSPIDVIPISAYRPTPPPVIPLDDDDDDNEHFTGNQTSASGRKIKRPSHLSGYKMSGGLGSDDNNGVKTKRNKTSHRKAGADNEFTSVPLSSSNPREAVEEVLMNFEALRRRHLQLDAAQESTKRPDLKIGAVMMANNLRANIRKRIGVVPGVEIGDIFYFRMELCIIGLHAPTMAGIDYMTHTFGDKDDDSVAVCIVAAGVYENEDDATDTLVYSGSGGSSKNNEEMHDQKLERGNLALQMSLSRKNVIRVVRGFKDPGCLGGKVYMYDGLYKIHESWKERTKTGINCFKYKLLREPGQPEGMSIWKMSRKWVENPGTRGRVLHPDLSSGTENLPVCLVNDVDSEKGPGLFTYITQVKYPKPLSSMKPLQGCSCLNACLPSDTDCGCTQFNGGNLPYSSTGLLVCRKNRLHECGESCQCSVNCRNRVTQKGVRVHFEIFRTGNRGWGLRSWDPIRAGSFICEYVGEVIDESKLNLDGEDDYVFQTVRPGEKTLKWDYVPELRGLQITNNSADTFEPLPIKISAKKMGNIARFMNHSCSPKAFWQPVQFDHGDDGHPHIMFFALKHIPPMTELTYDYGDIGADSSGIGSPGAKRCLCGSSNCRGYFC